MSSARARLLHPAPACDSTELHSTALRCALPYAVQAEHAQRWRGQALRAGK